MKKWISGFVLVLAFALCSLAQTGTSGSSTGQSGSTDQTGSTAKSNNKSSDSNAAPAKGAAKATTVTGCLNGSAGNYTLTNGRYKNGVAVTAASGVDMAPHVGHTVRLTGTWEKGSGSAAAGGTSASKTFNATAMKHISETCSSGGAGSSGAKTSGSKKSNMSGDTSGTKSDSSTGSTSPK